MPAASSISSAGDDAAHHHVVTLVGVGANEAAIEIVDEIRRAPVEMRRDRRHIRGEQARDHQAEDAVRQERQHRRVGGVVADQAAIEIREARARCRRACGNTSIDDERDDDPRPRAQRVVSDVEEQRAAERIALALRGEDALRDVAAAAGLRAGIPHRPPRDRQRQDQHRQRQRPVVEIRQQLQRRRRDLRDQPDRPPTCGWLQRVVGGGERCRSSRSRTERRR